MLSRQFMRFVIAGTLGFVVDAGVLYLATSLGAGLYLGRAMSFFSAVFVTWQINRKITFNYGDQVPRSLWQEWWRYCWAMMLGGAINFSAYAATMHFAPVRSWTPLLGVAVGTGMAMLWNFFFSKFWVFRSEQK